MLRKFKAGAGLGEPIDQTVTTTGAAGESRQLRAMAEPEFGLSGKVTAILGVAQDMTGTPSREDMLAAQQALWSRAPRLDEIA